MSRFIGLPLKHVEKDAKGQPVAFTWRGVTYRGKIISTWRLQFYAIAEQYPASIPVRVHVTEHGQERICVTNHLTWRTI